MPEETKEAQTNTQVAEVVPETPEVAVPAVADATVTPEVPEAGGAQAPTAEGSQEVGTEATPVAPEENPVPGAKVLAAENSPTEPVAQTKTIKKSREIIRGAEGQDFFKSVSNLLVPIVALVVFVLIVIFVYVPFGSEIKNTIDEKNAVMADVSRNQAKIDSLETLNVSLLDSRLSDVEEIVRDEMNVSDLAAQVESIAIRNALKPSSATVSNTGVGDLVEDDTGQLVTWVPEYASVINGPFSFMGKFADIMAFIEDLRKVSPTILSLSKISVTSITIEEGMDIPMDTGGEPLWNVNLYISGFVSAPIAAVDIEIPIYTIVDQSLLDEITERIAISEPFRSGTRQSGGSDSNDAADEE